MSELRIAVIGGGLAGMTLANALAMIPHVNVQIYEANSTISERGAALSLSSNALKALEHIFTVEGKKKLLAQAGAVPLNSVRNLVGSGPNAGQVIIDVPAGDESEATVHRASLLRELFALVHPENVHTGKRLTSISPFEDDTSGVEVLFDDGSKEIFDGLIGADGIFSSVRTRVLQDDGEGSAYAATPAGFWDCRALASIDTAKELLGANLFDAPRQVGWVGEGAFIMHDIIENGSTVHGVMSAVEDSAVQTSERKRPLDRKILEDVFGPWLDGPIGRQMIDFVLCEKEELSAYSQWEHKNTPRYNRGSICIMGDAAHAMTPWQGSGSATAFEDAVILQQLFRKVQSPSQIAPAFGVFDALRRPRCQKIIDSSRETGLILCGRSPEAGLDPEKLLGVLATKWDFIASLDMEQHKEEAVTMLARALDR